MISKAYQRAQYEVTGYLLVTMLSGRSLVSAALVLSAALGWPANSHEVYCSVHKEIRRVRAWFSSLLVVASHWYAAPGLRRRQQLRGDYDLPTATIHLRGPRSHQECATSF